MPERPDWMPPDVADVMRPFFNDEEIRDFLFAPKRSSLNEVLSELEREESTRQPPEKRESNDAPSE